MVDSTMAESMPDRVMVSGGAFNTAHPGNGLHFDHEATAEMAKDMVNGPLVRNHDRDISALAGRLTDIEVRRFSIHDDEEDEGEDQEMATRVLFEAELTSEFPAFEEVARTILVRNKHKMMNGVSIAFFAEGIEIRDDRVTLTGPYSFVHLGVVDTPAQKPEQGVGIDVVEFSQDLIKPSKQFHLSKHDGVLNVELGETGLVCMNMGELISEFKEEYGYNPLKGDTAMDMKVPQNPPGGSGEGESGEWSAPSLSDFTDEQWGDLSDSEKNEIASFYADAADSFTDNFDNDLNLPHHFPDSGNASLNGTRNALARLPQTENLHSSTEDVEAHLQAHLPDDDEEMAAWSAYLAGKMDLEQTLKRADVTKEDIGLSENELIKNEDGRKILDLTVDSNSSKSTRIPSMSEAWSTSVFSSTSDAENAPFEVSTLTVSNSDNTNVRLDYIDSTNDSDSFTWGELNRSPEEQKSVANPPKDGANLSDKKVETPSEETKTDEELNAELDAELEKLDEPEVQELSDDEEKPELHPEFEALKREHEELKSSLSEILEERKSKEASELEELRERLKLEFGVDENTFERLTTKEQLKALEAELRRHRQNRIPDVDVRLAGPDDREIAAQKETERKEWLKNQYVGEL